jgi:hypothetical protein
MIHNTSMSDNSTMNILKVSQQLYIDGDFDKAIEKTLASKDQIEAGLFHYNLGTLYLKKGDLGPARYHMEKAKKQSFSYPMLWNNLKVINSHSEVIDPTKSKVFTEKFVGHYMDLPLLLLSAIALIGLIGTLTSVRLKKLTNKVVIISLVLLSLSPVLLRMGLDKTYRFAIVMNAKRIHEGPSEIFEDYGEIPEGSRIIVSKYHDKWYYITSPSSFSGWIKKSALGFY